MELDGERGRGHLTYCTNIHAAEHWPDVARGLERHLPAIKRAFSPAAPMGVGLRLAASAAEALSEPAAMDELRALLGRDFYVYTINGFPYGTFHGQPVKDGAYRPDWSRPERLEYTNLLADHLAALLPDGMTGTVSSVPCTYKPWLDGADDARIERIVEHLLRHVAHLVALGERSGRTVMLALEPEPCCLLETIDETVQFFESHLYSRQAVARLGALTGLSEGAAERALRTHLGVCYDVCHAAVEYEDPQASIAALASTGIAIGKLQLSSALKVDPVSEESIAALRAFDEPVYLHQTIERRDGALVRYPDLGDAFAAGASALGAEWRSHFHVPVFLEHMEHFSTTQDFLREILRIHARNPVTEHLEVETYTWDVLPAAYRREDLSAAIARELEWVRDRLAGEQSDSATRSPAA